MNKINFENLPSTSTPVNATNLNLMQDNIEDVLYPIGSIHITSTNTNPSDTLGGTWTLVDKEFSESFKTLTAGTDYSLNTTNCNNTTSVVMKRKGHSLWFRFAINNKVALTDNELELLTLNFSQIGINSLTYTFFQILGFSDSNNGMVSFKLDHSSGLLSSTDVIIKNNATPNLPADSMPYLHVETTIAMNNMLDSACDKFYWKRTT